MNAKLALTAAAALLTVSGLANAGTVNDLAAATYLFKGTIQTTSCSPAFGLNPGVAQSGFVIYTPYTPKKGSTAAKNGSLLNIALSGATNYYCASSTSAALKGLAVTGANCYAVTTAFGIPSVGATPSLTIDYTFNSVATGKAISQFDSSTNKTGASYTITRTVKLETYGCGYTTSETWVAQ
jgi:hypothetical protein